MNILFQLDFKADAWYFWKTVYLLSCWDSDEKTDTTLMPVHKKWSYHQLVNSVKQKNRKLGGNS